jgi:co-chaperonin GroES (HSP10)
MEEKMTFKTYGRYILIELVHDEQKESESLVVLPTDYKKPELPYALGTVLGIAKDVKFDISLGETIIFEKRMLNKIEVFGKMYYLVLENYVYGGITHETDT